MKTTTGCCSVGSLFKCPDEMEINLVEKRRAGVKASWQCHHPTSLQKTKRISAELEMRKVKDHIETNQIEIKPDRQTIPAVASIAAALLQMCHC